MDERQSQGSGNELSVLSGLDVISGSNIVLVMNPASIQEPTKKSRANLGERMPAKNRNGLPAYQRIQSAIRKRIDDLVVRRFRYV